MAENADIIKQVLHKALETLQAHEEELGKLDAAVGDGDHGIGMVRGMTAAVARMGDGTPGQILVNAGMAFSDASGGASGALFGSLIMTIGTTIGANPIDAAKVHEALDAGMAKVAKLGKAKPGDKTLLDTLDPFVTAYGTAAADGQTITGAWMQALPAAEAGMKATAEMISKRGRSSRLGERTRGHIDAGSASMYHLLWATGELLQEVCPDSID